jgi:cytochrome b involved in lipid metabolism
MKTFFTIITFLFLGIAATIIVSGVISRDNRIAREAYMKNLDQKVAQISSSITDSEQKIQALDQKYQAAVAGGKSTDGKTTTATTKTTTTTTAPAKPKGTVLTKALVATHATAADCWIIVSGKVYSVSSYMGSHPGGRSVIIKVCGQDSTAVFKDRGGTGEHSSSAWSMLGAYLVGTMGATIKP